MAEVTKDGTDVPGMDAGDGTGPSRPESLDRLRRHVEEAAREVHRLRGENRQLADSLKELWSKAADQRGSTLTLDEDPEQLRRKIQDYISAVDHYLETTG